MTWERFFDALLPFLGVIIGVASTRLADERREKHERERIVVNRAIDIEGEALIELQDRLVALPAVWIKLGDMIQFAEDHGGADPEDAYEVATRAVEPMHRARVLVTRVMTYAASWPRPESDLPIHRGGRAGDVPQVNDPELPGRRGVGCGAQRKRCDRSQVGFISLPRCLNSGR